MRSLSRALSKTMTTMKQRLLHHYLFLLALVACFAMTGCSFLEEKPTSNITVDQIEDSPTGAALLVTGVYSNWLYDMFCWGFFPKVIEMDNDYISGPDWLFGYIGSGNFNGEDATEKLWTGPYNLINDANIAIRRINGMQNLTTAQRDNAIGEVLFQKAFAYFLLVRAFGPVPWLDEDVTSSGVYHQPRASVHDIYGHIIAMLTEANRKMYRMGDSGYQKGHVSAGSAAGMLAKVYATMAAGAMPAGTPIAVKTGAPYIVATAPDGHEVKICREPTAQTFRKIAVEGYTFDADTCWQRAYEWAQRVMGGTYGTYTLLPYDQLWKRASRDESEFMWAVRSVCNDMKYRTSVHTQFSGYKKSADSEFLASGGWVGNTYNWYALFDSIDYRITRGVRHFWRYTSQESYNGCFYYPQSWSVRVTGKDAYGVEIRQPDSIYMATGYSYQYSTDAQCLAFTTKYDDVEDVATEYADSNYPFLRYADVVLLCAEAANELGKNDSARICLNMVRERSNATLLAANDTRDAMRSLIIEERAKELACEGDRRWDLVRWGIYLDAMNAIGGYDDGGVNKNRYRRNLLFPIPKAEIDANPYIQTNNFGW